MASFESYKLTPARFKAILKNGPELLKHMILSPLLFSYLRADGTLTESMQDDIEALSNKHRRISVLLDLIPRRGNKGFETLLFALIQTQQDHIAQLLDESLALRFIKERDADNEDDNVVPEEPVIEPNPSLVNNPSGYFPVPETVSPGHNNLGSAISVTSEDLKTDPAEGFDVFDAADLQKFIIDCNLLIPLMDELTLKRVLSKKQPQEQENFKSFLKAVCGNPTMEINIIPVDHEKCAKNIKDKNDQDFYRVQHQPKAGLVVIISNKNFYEKPDAARWGTEHDVENLRNLFQKLNFDVESHCENTSKDIITIIEDTRKKDFNKYSMFMLFVLSHGEKGKVFGIDNEPVDIDESIIAKFDGKNCQDLRGKPKLFFFQACQGQKASFMQSDGLCGDQANVDKEHFKPSFAKTNHFATDSNTPIQENEMSNFFCAYASYKGYAAWKTKLGSCFIRTLVYVFTKFAHEKHIVDMLTVVNRYLSDWHIKLDNGVLLQTASVDSTLLKDLFLFPGYDGRDFK